MPKPDETYALAVETSGRVGSVALGRGGTVLFESSFSGFMRHSAELFDSLTALLANVGIRPAHVDRLYITAGPGSFTGIRIAVTLAKMMAYALGTKIVAVDTLDTLAENAAATDLTRILPVLDAKQNRFFVSLYERQNEHWHKLLPSALMTPDQILARIRHDNIPAALLGEGLTYYADTFADPLTSLLHPDCWPATARGLYAVGQKMALQGRFTHPDALTPAYIRKPDAVEKREQKNK